jgi:hypothetical protein
LQSGQPAILADSLNAAEEAKSKAQAVRNAVGTQSRDPRLSASLPLSLTEKAAQSASNARRKLF